MEEGKCPLCGDGIRVPASSDTCFCPSCGKQIITAAAIAFGASSRAEEPAASGGSALGAPDIDDPDAGPTSTDSESGESNSAETPQDHAEDSPIKASQAATPFLDSWKTSAGLFVLGCFCSYAIGVMPLPSIEFEFFVGLVYCVAVTVYAVWFYPALFKGNPPTTSATAVSFLNGLFGYVIFGILWNICLTKREIGISQYVLVIMEVLLIGLLLAYA